MKPYIFSLASGLLIGIIYSLIEVRSPAPPVVALIGLLGILIGETIPPVVKPRCDRIRHHIPGCIRYGRMFSAVFRLPSQTTIR